MSVTDQNASAAPTGALSKISRRRADALFAARDFEAASQAYERALRLGPDAEVLCNLLECYERLGETENLVRVALQYADAEAGENPEAALEFLTPFVKAHPDPRLRARTFELGVAARRVAQQQVNTIPADAITVPATDEEAAPISPDSAGEATGTDDVAEWVATRTVDEPESAYADAADGPTPARRLAPMLAGAFALIVIALVIFIFARERSSRTQAQTAVIPAASQAALPQPVVPGQQRIHVRVAKAPAKQNAPAPSPSPTPQPSPSAAPSPTPTPLATLTPNAARVLAAAKKKKKSILGGIAGPVSRLSTAAGPTLAAAQPLPAAATSRPASTPEPAATPVSAAQRIVDARFIRRVTPDYPTIAKEQNIEGTAVVLATIGPGGTVLSETLVQSTGNKPLDQAALAAARASTFVPPVVDGKPATETYRIVYVFSL